MMDKPLANCFGGSGVLARQLMAPGQVDEGLAAGSLELEQGVFTVDESIELDHPLPDFSHLDPRLSSHLGRWAAKEAVNDTDTVANLIVDRRRIGIRALLTGRCSLSVVSLED
jgi:hypothetical protein